MYQLIEHVENDKLVQHSFTYGTRPPLSHEVFVAKVKEWIHKGAVLPDKLLFILFYTLRAETRTWI